MYATGSGVGSQSLMWMLLDPSGRIVAQAAAAYDIEYPHSAWAQQNSLDWRRALGQVVARLLRDAAVAPASVATLGLASQVDGLVAVDAYGDPLHPAIIWLDRRGTSQTYQIREGIGDDEVRRITGLNTDASHASLRPS